jgi:hypothetical protein
MQVLSCIMGSQDSGNVIKVTDYNMTALNLKQSKCALGSIGNIENGSLI